MPVTTREPKKSSMAVYASALRTFFKAAGDKQTYTEEDVVKAAEKLGKRYKSSYVGLMIRVAKARLGNDFPQTVGFTIEAETVTKTRFTMDEMRAIIDYAVAELPREQLAYVVISTMYGVRCEELSRLEDHDYRPSDGSLYIRTAKKGSPKRQLVPSVLRPLLDGVEFSKVTTRELRATFIKLLWACGVGHVARYGWHSIRRALVTELYDAGVGELHIREFMRWSKRDIVEQYVVDGNYSNDARIFKVHPFLPMWRERLGHGPQGHPVQ